MMDITVIDRVPSNFYMCEMPYDTVKRPLKITILTGGELFANGDLTLP